MIRYKNGNLFDTTDRWIGHGCKHYGSMQSDLGRQVTERYPEVGDHYKLYCEHKTEEELMGDAVPHMVNPGLIIASMIVMLDTNFDPKAVHVGYDELRKALQSVFNDMCWLGDTELSIPKIGCGPANGDWDTISQIIKDICPPNITVTVWSL